MMRKLLLLLLIMFPFFCYAQERGNSIKSTMTSNHQPDKKVAILMVHFGTTYDDTRAVTIDAINAKVKQSFPEMEIREAYTSRIIMRRLKTRGILKQTPFEALLKLRSEGYTHVLVQSTDIIDGNEMESLRRDVASVASFFNDIRVGCPLLYSVEDDEAVVKIMTDHAKDIKGDIVWIGHGTHGPATAIYTLLDYMLKANKKDRFHVGTIEGYPTFDTMLAQLKARKAKVVTLVPFMFVAGNHANNDISVDWKQALEKAGFKVNVMMEGLGQIPEIQDMFIGHLKYIINNKPLDIMEKKAQYANETE